MQMKQALMYFVFKCELEIFDDSLIDWPTPPKRIPQAVHRSAAHAGAHHRLRSHCPKGRRADLSGSNNGGAWQVGGPFVLVAQHFASISAVAVTQSSCQGPQQVALFEHLESKVVKCVVPLVVDFRLKRVALRPHHRQQLVRHERPVRAVMGRAGMELPNDHRKRRARVLVMVRHHDALGGCVVLSDEHKWAAHSSSSTVVSPYRTIRTSVWCESSGWFEWVE